MNTIWSEWYYIGRFLGKPYPFCDNILPRPKIKNKIVSEEKERNKEDKKSSKEIF